MFRNRVLTSALLCTLFALSSTRLFAQVSTLQPVSPGAYLGVMVGPAKGAEKGILIRAVLLDSPAEKAGVKNGDVLMKVGDQQVQDVDHFLALVGAKKAGETVTIQVLRGGKEETLTTTLGESPNSQVEPRLRQGAMIGVRAEELTADRKTRLNAGTEAGVVVTEVTPDSPAAKAGLKRDDVITQIDGKMVKSPEELHKAIQSAGAGKEITIELFRGKEKMSVKATPKEG